MKELMIRDMKANIKVIGYGLWVMVVLFMSAPVIAQNFEAQQPNAAFQSTSTMMGSGSTYTSNPTLSENGTAYSPSAAAAPSGPHMAKKDLGLPDLPSTEGDEGNVPLGDAVLPLLLIALAYIGVTYIRKRTNARGSAHV